MRIMIRNWFARVCATIRAFDCRVILQHDVRDDARRTACVECGWLYKWKL